MLPMIVLGACACLSLSAPAPDASVQRAMAGTSASAAAGAPHAPRPTATGAMPTLAAALPVAAPVQSATATPAGRFVIIAPPMGEQGAEVTRAQDGLFYVTAIVNGAPIRFIVDTGATMVVLRSEDARRAGIYAQDSHFTAIAETAGGRTAMARVMLDEVVVGATRARSLSAAVVREGLPVSLLGQNWLQQLASLTISGDRMTFN